MSPDVEPSVPGATNFTFEKFWVKKATFEEIERQPVDKTAKRPPAQEAAVNISAGIQIGVNPDAPEFQWGEVTLGVTVLPDARWQPYRIEVVVAGRFRAKLEESAMEEFCQSAAPTILFPYVRQLVHSMTLDASSGPIRLQPMNVAQVLGGTWSEPQP